MVTKTLKITKM